MFTPQETAEILFPASVHRGRDSFGWMDYSEDRGFKVRKYQMEASEKEGAKYINIAPDVKFWLGHVRLATHGTPAYPGNNHPIVHKRWACVHNGVIRNYVNILSKTGRHLPLAEVDSEAIPAAVNKWGVKGGLKSINGDMATALVKRTKPGVIYLARGQGRPLWIGVSEGGAIYFASEEKILNKLWMRTMMNGRKCDFKWKAKPAQVDEYHLVVVRDGKLISNEPFKKVAPKQQESPRSTYYSGYTMWDDDEDYLDWLEHRAKQDSEAEKKRKGDAVPFPVAVPKEQPKGTTTSAVTSRRNQSDLDHMVAGLPTNESLDKLISFEKRYRQREEITPPLARYQSGVCPGCKTSKVMCRVQITFMDDVLCRCLSCNGVWWANELGTLPSVGESHASVANAS